MLFVKIDFLYLNGDTRVESRLDLRKEKKLRITRYAPRSILMKIIRTSIAELGTKLI